MLFRLSTRLLFLLAVALACLSGGCARSPEQLHRDAVQGEQQAREAWTKNDAKQARRASDRAAIAVSRLKKLVEANPQLTEEFRRQLLESENAARAAREHAEIAQEEYE